MNDLQRRRNREQAAKQRASLAVAIERFKKTAVTGRDLYSDTTLLST